ncbi:hypothetical protein VR010_04930 [Actinomycetaceae bacterium L2_0104]
MANAAAHATHTFVGLSVPGGLATIGVSQSAKRENYVEGKGSCCPGWFRAFAIKKDCMARVGYEALEEIYYPMRINPENLDD